MARRSLYYAPALALALPLGSACSRGEVPHPVAPPPQNVATTAHPATSRGGPDDAAADGGEQVGADAGDAARQGLIANDTARAPFGVRRESMHGVCTVSGDGHRISLADGRTGFADVNDLLALVNRSPTGGLLADDVPDDLVELLSEKPATPTRCEQVPCMRKEAASALRQWLLALRAEGVIGLVESAYRSYGAQCATFSKWAQKGGFCSAVEQSALPGHSQHQLGTTLDLFTERWKREGDGEVFRDGFGCTSEAQKMYSTAAEFGFVIAYPMHVSDRMATHPCVTRNDLPVGIHPVTGYRNEAWHFRYIGKDAAHALTEVQTRSPEVTLESWLRDKRQLQSRGDAELPVCDGCNCGACSSFDAEGPCKGRALLLRGDASLASGGENAAPPSAFSLAVVAQKVVGTQLELKIKVTIPRGVLTQPPVFEKGAGYTGDTNFYHVATGPKLAARNYAALGPALRLAVGSLGNSAFPYRFALTRVDSTRVYNKANVLLPAETGTYDLVVKVPVGTARHVVILRGESEVVVASPVDSATP